jgi:hypothetical protein
MVNKGIHKYKSWAEVPDTNLEFWLKKTPAERLEAAKKLIERAENLYHSNPKNKKLYNERRLTEFHSIAERTRD